MTAERHQERLDGYDDTPCPECGHMQTSFAGGCDNCGWQPGEDDPDRTYDAAGEEAAAQLRERD